MDSVEGRFWANVVMVENCWEWAGVRNQDGYGRMRVHGRYVTAHRLAYEIRKGPSPDGLTLDHLCRNRGCVNPDHLDAVSHKEICLRGTSFSAINAAKTHCPQGHELSGGNLYVHPRGERICRTCRKASRERYEARQ